MVSAMSRCHSCQVSMGTISAYSSSGFGLIPNFTLLLFQGEVKLREAKLWRKTEPFPIASILYIHTSALWITTPCSYKSIRNVNLKVFRNELNYKELAEACTAFSFHSGSVKIWHLPAHYVMVLRGDPYLSASSQVKTTRNTAYKRKCSFGAGQDTGILRALFRIFFLSYLTPFG